MMESPTREKPKFRTRPDGSLTAAEKCPRCGNWTSVIQADKHFCPKCGKPLDKIREEMAAEEASG